jgi:hypothetical protein
MSLIGLEVAQNDLPRQSHHRSPRARRFANVVFLHERRAPSPLLRALASLRPPCHFSMSPRLLWMTELTLSLAPSPHCCSWTRTQPWPRWLILPLPSFSHLRASLALATSPSAFTVTWRTSGAYSPTPTIVGVLLSPAVVATATAHAWLGHQGPPRVESSCPAGPRRPPGAPPPLCHCRRASSDRW